MSRACYACLAVLLLALPALSQPAEITRVKADILGNEALEEVSLVGVRHPSTGYYRRLALEVRQNGQLLTSYDLPDGYEPRLRFYDFTGDRRPEAWISTNSRATAGDGGATYQTVLAFTSGKAQALLDSRHQVLPRVSGNFMDYYRALLTVETLKQSEYIDLGEFKNLYDKAGYYREGILLKPAHLWNGNAYSGARAVDPNGDGTYELEVTQDLYGYSNADKVARVAARLSYRESQWQPVGVWITHLP